MALIRLLGSSLQIQSVFFDLFEQKTNMNQTILVNLFPISLWLFIVITFFNNLTIIIS